METEHHTVHAGQSSPLSLGAPTTTLMLGVALVFIAHMLFLGKVAPLPLFVHPLAFLPVHGLLEMITVVIGMTIFLVGWNTYSQSPPENTTWLACAFLAAALLHFIHLLAYSDVHTSGASSGSTISIVAPLAARLLIAGVLLGIAIGPHRGIIVSKKRYYLLASSLAFVALVGGLGIVQNGSIPIDVVEAHWNTTPGQFITYSIMGLHLATLIVLGGRPLRDVPLSIRSMLGAVLFFALGELSFAASQSATDTGSLLGHLYRVAGYGFVGHAVFRATISHPYEQLRRTEQQRQEEQEYLRASEERFRLIAENARDAIFRYRVATPVGFEYISPAIVDITGYDPADYYANASLLAEIVHPDDREALHEMIAPAGEPGDDARHLRGFHKDGTPFWTEYRNWHVYDDDGSRVAIEGIIRDITEHKQAEARIHYMAFYDTLTDLPNRALFHDRLRQAILQARHGGHLVAVLFLGIDRLKVINDTLGHSTGDQLLRAVAERLRSSVQERDTVARLSGDEFALVFASPASMQDAAQMARHMLTVLARPFYLNNHELYTSASIGIALYPTDTTDAELLVQYADVAMARAKNQGRNNYTFYTNTLHTRTLEWLKLENDLRKAIEWGNFCLHYQPQIDLRNGRIVGVEALVRWRHPQLGFLSPNRFIPIAEESGLIIPLGRWILHTACTQCRAWQLQGLPAVRVAVNLSALQLARAEIVSETTQILRDTGLEPPYLELELTESMLMHDAEATIATLYQLKQQGVSLAIDDFGTGYSSLSYLKRLPIDTLKIDASFIQDIPHNPDDAAIATTIINMAHNLNLRVIAEGVENERQEQFLFEHGCNEVQGYRYGRPTPASDLARMLADPHHYIPIHLNVSNGDSTTSIVRQHSN